jgi:hypothetical protein
MASHLTCLLAGSSGSRVYYPRSGENLMELAWTGSGWDQAEIAIVSAWGGAPPVIHTGSAFTSLYAALLTVWG